MAWTVNRDKTVFGNKQVQILNILTDSAEVNLDTGLNVVDGFSLGVASITTFAFKMAKNVDSSGTAANGKIGISGVTSGDEFCLVVYGR